jgi:DNA-binding transcriptional ArsR family regulator
MSDEDSISTITPANASAHAPLSLDLMAAQAEAAAALLRSLGNANRLMVLCHLLGGELSVGQLGRAVGLSQSALSQHLARLRAEGLVATRRAGAMIHYRIADPAVRAVIGTLHALYCGSAAPDRISYP